MASVIRRVVGPGFVTAGAEKRIGREKYKASMKSVKEARRGMSKIVNKKLIQGAKGARISTIARAAGEKGPLSDADVRRLQKHTKGK